MEDFKKNKPIYRLFRDRKKKKKHTSMVCLSCNRLTIAHLELMERVENIFIFVFFHIVLQCFIDGLNCWLYFISNDSRYMFGSILDSLPIVPVIVRVKEIAVWKIYTVVVIGVKYVTSRFLFLIVNLDGWVFLFNTLPKSFLFAPCILPSDRLHIVTCIAPVWHNLTLL